MTTLALVAISARVMAEAAARDGFDVVAIDLFGDADTRRVSSAWWPAGEAGVLRIDGPLVLGALQELAQRADVAGWVPGSGCEGQPELLAAGAALLPLIGTAPPAVQRTRDPLAFFGFLAAQGIAHPEVRSTAPADADGWLVKDAHGCGGWHIRHAAARHHEQADAHHYFQRRAHGTPMSATFCANGSEAVLLGFNEIIVRAFGVRPFVYCGVVGPVPLAETPARQVTRVIRLLTAEMVLQGLCSLDFMLDGDEVQVLEVNPRPPASMALYGQRPTAGLMVAHVDACLHGRLPALRPAEPAQAPVHGSAIVFAPRPLQLDDAAALGLQNWPDCHDLPAAGTHIDRGDPLCSLSASGHSAAQIQVRLNEGRQALLKTLEKLP
jgi:predicted ATP-grasp superfamily ATP-dependent carboligase